MRVPLWVRRSYLESNETATGRDAGEPPATRSAFDSVALPTIAATPPLDAIVAVRLSSPLVDGLRKPVLARLSPSMATMASSGVSVASVRSIGPTAPVRLNVPPPGNIAVAVIGQREPGDRSDAATLTWSYVRF